MRTWRHSGFSVDRSVFLEAGDSAGIERLAQYMVRCPFSISRVLRAKAEREGQSEAPSASLPPDDEPSGSREARRRWAALIQRVFEVDPLECPECSGTMRVISFIERRQSFRVERILRHCELGDPPTRGPPEREAASAEVSATDLEIEPDPEYEQWLPACGRQVGEP